MHRSQKRRTLRRAAGDEGRLAVREIIPAAEQHRGGACVSKDWRRMAFPANFEFPLRHKTRILPLKCGTVAALCEDMNPRANHVWDL